MPIGKPLSLKARALRALALRDHSRSELRDKLLRAGREQPVHDTGNEPPDREDRLAELTRAVETLLDDLEARGWLSDARFVESRVQVRGQRFGNLRIRQELARHGLQVDEATRQQLESSEYERAMAVWRRKFAEPATDRAGMARQARFLAGRGFSADVVRRVLRHDDEG